MGGSRVLDVEIGQAQGECEAEGGALDGEDDGHGSVAKAGDVEDGVSASVAGASIKSRYERKSSKYLESFSQSHTFCPRSERARAARKAKLGGPSVADGEPGERERRQLSRRADYPREAGLAVVTC